MWVKNRDSYIAGPNQDVTAIITEGTQYWVEFWVKMAYTSDTIRAHFVLDTTMGAQYESFDTYGVGTTWTKIEGTLTPWWYGELLTAYWEVRTASGTQEFKIDDALLVEGSSPLTWAMVPVPGTWRSEVGG